MMIQLLRLSSILLLWLLSCSSSYGQLRLLSWNIENLGASKSEAELGFIAGIISDSDVVALQEVVAGPAGPAAVASLVKELNRNGGGWAFTVSAPTSGSPHSRERYAFLWRRSAISKIGNAWLDSHFKTEIDREPYMAVFSYEGKQFTLVSFHATTKKKKPESEIKYFKLFPDKYPGHNLVFVGDFNLPQSHSVFTPLRTAGWQSAFKQQKTSLRQKCVGGDCLASEYDNIWYDGNKIRKRSSAAVHTYKVFSTIKEARVISDHIPVTAILEIK